MKIRSAFGICAALLLIVGIPSPLMSTPVSYEIQWKLLESDTLENGQRAQEFSKTAYTYDPVTSLFGGFVVAWVFPGYGTPALAFDFAGPINASLSSTDRAQIANSLLSPGDSLWYGRTHSHNQAEVFLNIDAPGVTPVVLVSPIDGTYFAAASQLRQSHAENGAECGPSAPRGCNVGGTYTVSRIPEGTSALLVTLGGLGLLFLHRQKTGH